MNIKIFFVRLLKQLTVLLVCYQIIPTKTADFIINRDGVRHV